MRQSSWGPDRRPLSGRSGHCPTRLLSHGCVDGQYIIIVDDIMFLPCHVLGDGWHVSASSGSLQRYPLFKSVSSFTEVSYLLMKILTGCCIWSFSATPGEPDTSASCRVHTVVGLPPPLRRLISANYPLISVSQGRYHASFSTRLTPDFFPFVFMRSSAWLVQDNIPFTKLSP